MPTTRPGTLLRHAVPTRGGPPDTSRPGSVEAYTVAHCDDSTEGDYVNSLTFTELYSGWTENREVWNKSASAVLALLEELERSVPLEMKDFHTDNGGRVPQLGAAPTSGRVRVRLPWTRSRAYRKNDNAHCEPKKLTHVRQRFRHEPFGHPGLVTLMNDLYAREWSQFSNHFKPTFKLRKREKQAGRTSASMKAHRRRPASGLLESPQIPEATKAQHARLESIEAKLEAFLTALSNLNREATKS